MRPRVLLLFCLALAPGLATGADYALEAREIAQDTYVVEGRNEDFSVANGGAVVNVGFIVTSAGVVVIDTGPSARFGQALRALIRNITPLPVLRVYNTHHHPDHFLGNQAFPAASIEAAPDSISGQQREGPGFLDNMYRLLQHWATGTELQPAAVPSHGGRVDVGDHPLEILLLRGHTAADLAVFDHSTGVLFAGDLVFNGRAPTVPHAGFKAWQASLDRLAALPFGLLVPGHGPVSRDASPLQQTADYLHWLDAALETAAADGLDATDLLEQPVDPRFRGLAVIESEYPRAVMQRFPEVERRHLSAPTARP
jgi:quinoprotein relay system zinc metallohydrolase 1